MKPSDLIAAGFRGTAKRLDDIDLPVLGKEIGVGEDELHAFMEVETAGSGFDSKGRPKMLFEPHKFYGLLVGSKQAAAVKAGLAYPKWGTKPYPAESYTRLIAAMSIDPEIALQSASWGLGQIMGEHYRILNYKSAAEMVAAFMEDEEAHLAGMIDFIQHNHIDDDLRAHRWEVVARVYNGPGYAKHNYHGRMAAAFAKWQKIRDTPMPSGTPVEAPKPVAAPVVAPVVANAVPAPSPAPGKVDIPAAPKTGLAALLAAIFQKKSA